MIFCNFVTVSIGLLQALVDDGFYLLGSNDLTIKSGTIICVRDGESITMIDEKPTICIGAVKEFLIKLEEDEARFLGKYSMDKRLKKYEKGKFRIFRNLSIGQECRLRGNISSIDSTYVIKRQYDDKDGLKFDLEKKVLFPLIHGDIDVGL